jgi:hypothetical protein
MATDGDAIWVKDFDYIQINALEVKSIPYKTLFYSKEGKLFLLNSALPDRNIPSLLWTPIERAIAIELPRFNHNFFGIEEKIELQIIPSQIEATAIALLTQIDLLKAYTITAPEVRLQKISWTLLNDDEVLLLGTPLLPISGKTFWQRGDFLLPTGFDVDLYLLIEILNLRINPERKNWVIWNPNSTYFLIPKSGMERLSLSGFRKTID